jgi:hypothetical protein
MLAGLGSDSVAPTQRYSTADAEPGARPVIGNPEADATDLVSVERHRDRVSVQTVVALDRFPRARTAIPLDDVEPVSR